MIYKEELKEFNKLRVRYIIVGGIAFNLLGGMRATADLDILIDLTESNLSKVIAILSKYKYKLFQPIDPMDILNYKKKKALISDKNMRTLSFIKENSLQAVDIIFDSSVSFDKAQKSVIKLNIEGIRLPVVGISELMTMKKTAWRPIDRADYAELQVIKRLKKK